MDKKNKKISKVKSVVNEIAYDLGISKKLVKQVLLLTFKEVALALLLKGKPVMIRRFVKFVVAATRVSKMAKNNRKKQKQESE